MFLENQINFYFLNSFIDLRLDWNYRFWVQLWLLVNFFIKKYLLYDFEPKVIQLHVIESVWLWWCLFINGLLWQLHRVC